MIHKRFENIKKSGKMSKVFLLVVVASLGSSLLIGDPQDIQHESPTIWRHAHGHRYYRAGNVLYWK